MATSSEPLQNTQGGKHHFLLVVVSVLALSLVIVSVMLWREWSRRFPKMDPGTYVGYITNLAPASRGAGPRTWLYVERLQDRLLFSVLAPGWSPQEVTELPAPVGDALLPITIEGPTEKIALSGGSDGSGGYYGTFESGISKGVWELHSAVPSESRDSLKDIKLALLLEAELHDTETKIREAELKVPQQRAEIDKLTVFITEGERLKARANERFVIAKDELEKAQKELVVKQNEAKKLQESLEIMQKLSGMGKLVALSRESLEREGRWIESMAKSTTAGAPADLEAAVERGEKILALKKEIGDERRKIAKLTLGLEDGSEGASSANTDDGKTPLDRPESGDAYE